MHIGLPPFYGSNELEIFNKILDTKYKLKWPREFYVSPQAKDLVEKLLQRKPSERLGAGAPGSNNDFKALFKHVYFSKIDKENIEALKVPVELPKNVLLESQSNLEPFMGKRANSV